VPRSLWCSDQRPHTVSLTRIINDASSQGTVAFIVVSLQATVVYVNRQEDRQTNRPTKVEEHSVGRSVINPRRQRSQISKFCNDKMHNERRGQNDTEVLDET